MRAVLAFLLLVPLATLLAACRGDSLVSTPGMTVNYSDAELSSDEPRLQILVTYNENGSTHAALRLEHPERGTLFWDPGGVYGTVAAPGDYGWIRLRVGRKNDLIHANVPTLPVYWRFAVSTRDTAMEVFEWELTERHANELFTILLAGAEDSGRPDGFTTDTVPFYCTVSLSDFLQRYGRGIATVPDRYFWPSELADRLRTQSPNRIFVFSVNKSESTYVSTRQ